MRNYYLDILKVILTVLVIAIHTIPFNDYSITWNDAVSNGIARIAVPCFFTINGYFLMHQFSMQKFKAVFFEVLIIYVFWTLVYLPFYWDAGWKEVCYYLVFGWYHLWYVSSLLLVIILLALFYYFKVSDKMIVGMAISLFLAGVVLQDTVDGIYTRMYRNGIFMGLPFASLGYMMCKHKDSIKMFLKGKKIGLWIVAGMATLILEGLFIRQCLGVQSADMLIATLFLSPLIVFWMLCRKKIYRSEINIGKLATLMFLIHPFFLPLVTKMLLSLSIQNSFTIFITETIVSFLAGSIILGIMVLVKRWRGVDYLKYIA